jgi:AcrR family transcriptional regulator
MNILSGVTGDVKRIYDGRRRAVGSQATRRRILDAARTSFLERGYRATTMKGLAAAAQVHVDTVYELVGRKPDLARTLVEHALSGVDEVVPAEQRSYVAAIRAEPDPRRKIAIYAGATRAMLERVAPLFVVLRDAASSDHIARQVWRSFSERRALNMREFVRDVADAAGGLRDGMSTEEAADTVWVTNSPAVYLMLTDERGWSSRRYERWLLDTWARLLLDG